MRTDSPNPSTTPPDGTQPDGRLSATPYREPSASAVSPVMIRDLNDDEKPREKALKQGIDSLTDVELLALLLGSGMPGKSVIDLSREILDDCHGRLRLLSRMSIPELKKKYKGVGCLLYTSDAADEL